MTRLLVIRCGDQYCKLTGSQCSLVPFARASVYPERELPAVEASLASVRQQYPEAVIRRLIIHEEAL